MTVHSTIDDTPEVDFKISPEVPTIQGGFYRNFGKRAADILLVLFASPILVPLTLVLAILIVFSGNRPIYVQERVGRGGKTFRMWKFRTMVQNAEDVLQHYIDDNPDARSEWDAHQKLKTDPRITIVGRFLRKTSLDELPQFWNVLIGEMSLVGPRPMMVDQQGLYPGSSYYRMRPGITGLWQISDRNECQFRDRAKFDGDYETVMSFKTDLRILSQTVGVVLRGTGY
jgi:lipopolysaccharide/colanic/teichoic acid biosynthesis glycosyltransferase